MLEYRDMVEPYVCDVSAYLYEAIKDGKEYSSGGPARLP